MKKFIVVFLLLAVLVVASFYLFIPKKISVANSVLVAVNADASYRKLSEFKNWNEWWPEPQATPSGNELSFKERKYLLTQKGFKSLIVRIKGENDSLSSQLLFVPINKDSMSVQWNTEPIATSNFIARIHQYFKAKSLQKDMAGILASLKPFLEKKENLYQVDIKEQKVKDTVLLASRMVSNSYPSTTEVYSLIRKLKNYIQRKGGKETDHPMLHVDSMGGKFMTMVGVPIERTIQGNGSDIELKRMVLGNILVTEVKGGPQKIKAGLQQLELYLNDYQRTSPAIPFESLVTDRSVQSDTTQWITKIYYPII